MDYVRLADTTGFFCAEPKKLSLPPFLVVSCSCAGWGRDMEALGQKVSSKPLKNYVFKKNFYPQSWKNAWKNPNFQNMQISFQ